MQPGDDQPTVEMDPRASIVPPGPPVLHSLLATASPWSVARSAPQEHTGPGPDDGTIVLEKGAAATAPAVPPQPAFEMIQRVGRGGMGEVWEARQVSLRRLVAVKTIRSDLWRGTRENSSVLGEQWRNFEQEALTAGVLDHPNIVPVYDLGRDGAEGPPLLAMKLVRGESWSRTLERDFEAMDPDALLAKHLPVLLAVAQAVAFAHSRGIVHRDLKPAQVMTGEFGETLLTDWGIAVYVGSEEGNPSLDARAFLPTPLIASNPAGTPAMMAPEQTAASATGIGTWTDVYLLGGCLYFLLTGGEYPHAGKSPSEVMLRAASGVVPAPSKRRPDRSIPAELEALCIACMAAAPQDRTPSAAAFVQALKDFAAGTGRRRESEAAFARAEAATAAIAEGTGEDAAARYQRHTGIEAELAKALELWPENRAARKLRAENLAAATDAAIANGDLMLARAMAAQLAAASGGATDETRRREGAISAAEGRRRRHHRQRVALAWAAGALLVAAVGFAIVSQRNAREANRNAAIARANAEEAQRNLAIARSQGEGSQQLVDYVLEELRGQLDEQLTAERGISDEAARDIRHGVGGAVARRLADYYAGIDDSAWPADLRQQLARRVHRSAAMLRELDEGVVSIGLYERAVAIYTEVPPEDPARLGTVLLGLGKACNETGDFTRAESALRGALDAFRGDTAEGSTRLISATFSLVDSVVRLGRPEEARALLEGLRPYVREHDAGTEREAGFLASLAGVEGALGNQERAIELLRQSLAIYLAQQPQDLSEITITRNNLAVALSEVGDLDESLAILMDSLADFEERLGPHSLSAATARLSVATMLGRVERHREAIEYARASLEDHERILGPGHPATGDVLQALATALHTVGETEEALALQRRTVELRERALGRDHEKAIATTVWLALRLQVLREHAEAAELLRDAIDRLERKHGAGSAELYSPTRNYAEALLSMGRVAEARENAECALAIAVETKGPESAEAQRARRVLDRIAKREGAAPQGS